MRISQLRLPDGTKRWFGPRQTFALSAYPRLPLKFNTSTNTELMKPIPGAVAAKASFVDSNGHADRDFVFTRGREMDSNETATKGELTR